MFGMFHTSFNRSLQIRCASRSALQSAIRPTLERLPTCILRGLYLCHSFQLFLDGHCLALLCLTSPKLYTIFFPLSIYFYNLFYSFQHQTPEHFKAICKVFPGLYFTDINHTFIDLYHLDHDPIDYTGKLHAGADGFDCWFHYFTPFSGLYRPERSSRCLLVVVAGFRVEVVVVIPVAVDLHILLVEVTVFVDFSDKADSVVKADAVVGHDGGDGLVGVSVEDAVHGVASFLSWGLLLSLPPDTMYYTLSFLLCQHFFIIFYNLYLHKKTGGIAVPCPVKGRTIFQ